MAKRCQDEKCRTWNPEDAKFCRNCGKLLPDSSSENPKKTDDSNKIGNFILGIICVIAIIVAWIFYFDDEISYHLAVCITGGAIMGLRSLISNS